jgi:hypothetical protein
MNSSKSRKQLKKSKKQSKPNHQRQNVAVPNYSVFGL